MTGPLDTSHVADVAPAKVSDTVRFSPPRTTKAPCSSQFTFVADCANSSPEERKGVQWRTCRYGNALALEESRPASYSPKPRASLTSSPDATPVDEGTGKQGNPTWAWAPGTNMFQREAVAAADRQKLSDVKGGWAHFSPSMPIM